MIIIISLLPESDGCTGNNLNSTVWIDVSKFDIF